MAFAETAPLIATLDLKGNFASQLKKNQSALSSFSGSLGRAGRGAGQLGAGFARIGTILGTVAVGGLVGAAKAAIDFEDAFAGVRKTVDEADLKAVGLSFDALAKQFRTMATEIPIAATEFARIGEAAGALGIKAQDIDDFTKTVALLGVTTDLTTDQAAESLGKIGTILGFTGDDFEEFADILVKLGNTGASVESEITEIVKRFASSGKQAGLSTAQIAAYASAIASAGVEAESGGSSLSRLFGNLITDTANATAEGKAFAKVTGKSFKDFSKIVKDDTNGAMLLFLDSLNDLDKFGQQQALEAVGITQVRDRNAIIALAETYEKNLVPALKNAEEATGSLSKEAQERFNTIASKLTLLKNNFIEAAITIGEGFLPALGRATDKLIAFLKVDANKSALKGIGEDIGKALDSINWDDVLVNTVKFVGLLKNAASVAMSVLGILNKLPTEIKAAGLGFLALNKLSGGLIGAGATNVIAGLASAIVRAGAAKLPIVGSLFAQPVFVTNWAMIGTAGGLSSLVKGGGLAVALTAAGLAALAGAIAVGVRGDSPTSGDPNKPPLPGQEDRRIFEIERRIESLRRLDPSAQAFPGSTTNMSTVAQEISKLTAELTRLRTGGLNLTPGWTDKLKTSAAAFDAGTGPTGSGGRELRSTFSIDAAIQRGLAAGFKPTRAAAEATVQRNLERLAAANLAATNRVRDAAASGAAASLLTAAAVQNMDRKPPTTNVAVTVNVTAAQVAKSIVIQKRFGPPNGSRGAMPGDSGV